MLKELLLRSNPAGMALLALPRILRLLLTLSIIASAIATVVMGLYAVGIDPLGIAYDWFVGLVEQAVKDAVGDAL
ncbi:hypothetical protein J2754_001564 [Halarchaeum solikamskense]|uniref:hypothetical protein n=1 Tax=Halarchaeum nitratireducens TaxID=489913 RepID=UPI001B3B1A1B|nr:hypothetical protein [Halarchaeum solikamskense]MBP2251243.1 hypothetical protein [Halarchaeum solikamskense]